MEAGEQLELLPVRSWRVSSAEPRGAQMWFDPDTEIPCLRSASPDPESAAPEPIWDDGTLEDQEGKTL